MAPMFNLSRLVLDTSVFTNPHIHKAFGETPTAALAAFIEEVEQLEGTLECYMPPSVYTELGHFVDFDKIGGEVEIVVRRKAPAKYELSVPAFLLYEIVEDVRRRVDKGLRVAEEAVRQSGIRSEPETINNLRKHYREALREGIIDSTEDVELILLAKEMDAILVSADRGVVTWADKLGIRWLDPTHLKSVIDGLLQRRSQPNSGQGPGAAGGAEEPAC